MLHTSIFVPKRQYCALNPEVWINSNQVMIDKLNHNTGHTYFPKAGYWREKHDGAFAHTLQIKDPVGVAKDFYRQMQI